MLRIWVFWLSTLMLSQAGSEPVILSRRQIAAGKKLYEVKCAKCHRLREPTDYSSDEWRLWFGKMSRKAKLNPAQESLLSRYLDECRSWKSSTNNVHASSPTRRSQPESMTNGV